VSTNETTYPISACCVVREFLNSSARSLEIRFDQHLYVNYIKGKPHSLALIMCCTVLFVAEDTLGNRNFVVLSPSFGATEFLVVC